ncbi:hypothetical protein DRE_01118 [Drechslerella stenobrocha 248]|uniref:Uncharacterized protein n=1 Tax=Drechslerella stenobrocha 248 TaxID=1043628 RepID=W7HW47_9PEZI|nr:hypothetical protein DRE_01118 [Drechslerella stenobrocha 248]
MDNGDTFSFSDALGQPRVTCNSRGILLWREHDALNRETECWMSEPTGAKEKILLHRKIYGETAEDAARFNLRGKTWSVEDQSGLRTYNSFDMNGNNLSETFRVALEYKSVQNLTQPILLGDDSYITSRQFDALGRVTGHTNAQKQTVSTTYHDNGLIRSITTTNTDAVGKVVIKNVVYTADGAQQEVHFGNQTALFHEYDPVTRILKRKTLRRANGTILQDLRYNHDCHERIILKTDSAQSVVWFRNQRVDPAWEYTYDTLGRLTQTTGRTVVDLKGESGNRLNPYKAKTAIAVNQGNGLELCRYIETYRYNDAGSIMSMKQETLEDIGVTGWTRTFSYNHPSLIDPSDCNNSLSACTVGGKSETYERNTSGCIIKMPNYSTLEWDFNDRLRSVSTQVVKKDKVPETTYFVYDSDGERVRKVTERPAVDGARFRDTLNLPGLCIYTTFQADGSTKVAEKCTSEVSFLESVVFLSEVDLISREPLVRFIPDENIELDDLGNIASYEEYSAFGSTVYVAFDSAIDASRKYRYAKYERDKETGLYFCATRYLASWLAQWSSPDPLFFVDGFHLYAYVGNDPINCHDPTGTTKNKQPSKDPITSASKDGVNPEAKGLAKINAQKISLADFEKYAKDPVTGPGINEIISDYKGTRDLPVIGHMHHLCPQKYRLYYAAAGVPIDSVTLLCDSALNLILFKASHDASTDEFMAEITEKAIAYFSDKKGKAEIYRDCLLNRAWKDPTIYKTYGYIRIHSRQVRAQMMLLAIKNLQRDMIHFGDIKDTNLVLDGNKNGVEVFSVKRFQKVRDKNMKKDKKPGNESLNEKRLAVDAHELSGMYLDGAEKLGKRLKR